MEEVKIVKDMIATLKGLDQTSFEASAQAFRSRPYLESNKYLALAYASEAIRRTQGITLRDTQLLASLSLDENTIIDMKTGEGKTVTSLVSAYMNVLKNGQVHLATVNPYLAQRDFKESIDVLKMLGVTSGLIDTDDKFLKKESYSKDIVYGTMENFVFDYVSDGLVNDVNKKTRLKNPATIILDEADLVLLDNALTPFVISTFLDSERILKSNDELKQEVDDLTDENFSLASKMDKVVYSLYKEQVNFKDVVYECATQDDFEYLDMGQIKGVNLPEHLLGNDRRTIRENAFILKYNNKFSLTDTGHEALGYYLNNLKVKKILKDYNASGYLNDRELVDGKFTVKGYLKGMTLLSDDLREKLDTSAINELNENMHFLNNALTAYFSLENNKDYIIRDGNIELVIGGRIADGRSYSDGLSLAVELKEKTLNNDINIKKSIVPSYTLPLRSYLKTYDNILGMSGTTNELAFDDIYELKTKYIPKESEYQNKVNNKNYPERNDLESVFTYKEEDKYKLILNDCLKARQTGRPLLISTINLEDSEKLFKYLTYNNIQGINLLNANTEKEAEIIKGAGNKGSITISTDMAGRGTDIKLTDDTRALGGLKVIGMGPFPYKRSDDQVKGRSGRGFDPGESIIYYSLDDLIRLGVEFTPKDLELLQKRNTGEYFIDRYLNKLVDATQRRKESYLVENIRRKSVDYELMEVLQNKYRHDRNLLLETDIKEFADYDLKDKYQEYYDIAKDKFDNNFENEEVLKNRYLVSVDNAWQEFYERSKDVLIETNLHRPVLNSRIAEEAYKVELFQNLYKDIFEKHRGALHNDILGMEVQVEEIEKKTGGLHV